MAKSRQLSMSALRRIGRAVAKFERGDRNIQPTEQVVAFDDPERIRLCKTTAAWDRNTEATLEIWEKETPPDEEKSGEETIKAINKMYRVPSGAFVHVAQAENGTWYLVEAGSPDDEGTCKKPVIGGQDLTALADYDATKKQALIHDAGCMKWLTIEECPTEPPA